MMPTWSKIINFSCVESDIQIFSLKSRISKCQIDFNRIICIDVLRLLPVDFKAKNLY